MVEMLVSATAFFVVDQAVKRWVELRVAGGAMQVTPYLSLRPVMHRKSFYTLPSVRIALVGLWIAAVLSSIALALLSSFTTPLSLIALGAALGGALGNLRDIISYRSVRDFIDLGWWPVFNVADIGIVGGLTIAFLAR